MLTPDVLLQNRYRIQMLIAQGGMGAIYKAVDERLGITVALKETLYRDALMRKAFEREARLLARLRHPVLPRVSDHFVESDRQFLVMEFIPGEDLADMLEQNPRPFPVSDVLTWTDQLLDALNYIHSQYPPIIHRDIKPQNLKLIEKQIILLDFGLAKAKPLHNSPASSSGSIYGFTPGYAPLEQIRGTGTDARSDLYSLAATIYHLLTGQNPPDVLTRAAEILRGSPDPLIPANLINEEVPYYVGALLMNAMAQSPEQRPSNALEMRRELNRSNPAPELMEKSDTKGIIDSSLIRSNLITDSPASLAHQAMQGDRSNTESLQNTPVKGGTTKLDIQPGFYYQQNKPAPKESRTGSLASQGLFRRYKQITPILRRVIIFLLVVSGFSVLTLLSSIFTIREDSEDSLDSQIKRASLVDAKTDKDPRLVVIEEAISRTSREGQKVIEKVQFVRPEFERKAAKRTIKEMIDDSTEAEGLKKIEPLGWEASIMKGGQWRLIFHYHRWPSLFLQTEWRYEPRTNELYLINSQNGIDFWTTVANERE